MVGQKYRFIISTFISGIYFAQLLLPLFLLSSILYVQFDQTQLLTKFDKSGQGLEKISVPISELDHVKWVDEKEIFYNNEMYDVAAIRSDNYRYVFTVIKDDREKKLCQSNQQQQAKDLIYNQFKYFSFCLYVSDSSPEECDYHFNFDEKVHSCYIESFYCNASQKVPSPPPDSQA